MPENYPWVEYFYWYSQIALFFVQLVLVVIFGATATAAFKQFRTYKLYQLLLYLETDAAKEARRLVITEIEPVKDQPWWRMPEYKHLEPHASEVCSHYDVLASIIEFDRCEKWLERFGSRSYGSFFRHEWGNSIATTYKILSPYIEDRRLHNLTRYRPYQRLAERIINEMEARP